MPARNPYAVLGVPLDASTDDIKAAWRRLARENHPDVTSGEPDADEASRRATRRMAEINAAYHELRDPERRRAHRVSAAREPRDGHSGEWHGTAGTGESGAGAPYGRPQESGHGPIPTPRYERPVTARIDTSSLLRPRNALLRPLGRSPLPGLPPRPRSVQYAEPPRASTPTGPTHRRPGPTFEEDYPTLAKALETELRFGKFEGLTLGDVLDLEPTYIDWMVRTIDRDPALLLAGRVVQRHMDRIVPARRRRLDTTFQRS